MQDLPECRFADIADTTTNTTDSIARPSHRLHARSCFRHQAARLYPYAENLCTFILMFLGVIYAWIDVFSVMRSSVPLERLGLPVLFGAAAFQTFCFLVLVTDQHQWHWRHPGLPLCGWLDSMDSNAGGCPAGGAGGRERL
jgi:hypothetical protein